MHVRLSRTLCYSKWILTKSVSCKSCGLAHHFLHFLQRQTITATLYLFILRRFVAVQNKSNDSRNIISFSIEDGTRPHRTPEVLYIFNEQSDDPVISLEYCKHMRSIMDRLPYLHNLTPCVFLMCVWGGGTWKMMWTAKCCKLFPNWKSVRQSIPAVTDTGFCELCSETVPCCCYKTRIYWK